VRAAQQRQMWGDLGWAHLEYGPNLKRLQIKEIWTFGGWAYMSLLDSRKPRSVLYLICEIDIGM